MKKVISILTSMLLLCFPAYSQDASLTDSQTEQKFKEIGIYFDQDSYAVDPEHYNNKDNLSDLIRLLQCDSLTTISKIMIDSYTSPEAGRSYNQALSCRRSEATRNFIKQNTDIPDSLLVIGNRGIAWKLLAELVAEYPVPNQQEVLNIIENIPEETWRYVKPTDRWLTMVDSRNKHLMDLQQGRPYRYMMKHIYPLLRKSTIVTVIYKSKDPIVTTPITFESNHIYTTSLQSLSSPQSIADPNYFMEGRPLFAVKTNLIYDAITAINIELEVPIKEKWSIAAEWICPWWVTKDNAYAIEVLSGQVEGRYWFGDRTNRLQLTGWFAGLYVGGGLYDLQWNDDGYQGEFYIAAGLSGGYAHTINKKGNLRMEYSLGLGYLNTDYRYYEGRLDNKYLVWQYDGKYKWIGPTKVEASLVWFINRQRGGKR